MITNRPVVHDPERIGPLPFKAPDQVEQPVFDSPTVAQEALRLVESMSARIDDLAREFGCLSYFEDDGDDDRPRAA
ncbi:MAG: hypothetical protein ACYTF9_00695 [Planctomycetota bacterium]|jgi:hypothetical protein